MGDILTKYTADEVEEAKGKIKRIWPGLWKAEFRERERRINDRRCGGLSDLKTVEK